MKFRGDQIARWISATCFIGVLAVCGGQFLLSFERSYSLDQEVRRLLVEAASEKDMSSEELDSILESVARFERPQIGPLKRAIVTSWLAGIGLSATLLLKPGGPTKT